LRTSSSAAREHLALTVAASRVGKALTTTMLQNWLTAMLRAAELTLFVRGAMKFS
jgi:hypothetical protein